MNKLFSLLIFITLLLFSSCVGVCDAPSNYYYHTEFEPKPYVWPYVRKPQPPVRTFIIKPTPPRPQGRINRFNGNKPNNRRR